MPAEESAISHWSSSIRGLQLSSKEFYDTLEQKLREEGMEGVTLFRVQLPEGGFFSARREQLRIKRQDLTFDVLAIPFGRNFRVSWKLSERDLEWLGRLIDLPFISWIAAPLYLILRKKPTQYRIDAMEMFQNTVHTVVLETLDELTSEQQVPSLPDSERKPIMRELMV